jgi:outer membrane protein
MEDPDNTTKAMKKLLLLAMAGYIPLFTEAQQTYLYSLQEVIEKAKTESASFKLASTQQEISYYQYLSFKSDFKPQISFYGNAPVYNKEFYGVRQPDGTIRYQAISQNNSNVGFSLSQLLPFTGGEVSLNTDLARFDDFKAKTKQYSGTPVYLRYSQPLFSVNELKWNQKIEPLRMEEAKRKYVQEIEAIAQQATSLYFDVLEAQSDMEIARVNLANTEANYSIEKKRINLGTTTEDRLLQLELQTLRSRQDLEKARYDYAIAQLNLKTYIGIRTGEELQLTEPEKIPRLNVDTDIAIEYAKRYRPEFISFERKMNEVRKDVALARAAKQQVNLVASYGLNNVGEDVGKVYQRPNDQQRFSIGFNIPLVDWGRRKARFNTAKAMEKLTEVNNEFEEATIYQEITSLIRNIELLTYNISLGTTTDSVAQRRYTIANNLYQMGKLSVTDLNLAQSEKDNARRAYIFALRAYWDAYYALRRVTFYDFEQQQPLFTEGKTNW